MSENFAANAFNNYGIWGGESSELASTEKDPLGINKKPEEIKEPEWLNAKTQPGNELKLDGSTDIKNRSIPAINSDDDLVLAIDDYARVADLPGTDTSGFAESIKNYRATRFFSDGVEPIMSVESKEESEKMNYAADLRRDWTLDPEARKRIEQKKGKAWADWYGALDEDDKARIGSYELLRSAYGADKDDFALVR
ncbi:MAG: hypothetical protein RR553_09550, partial [Akkermansia sp.]